MTKKGNVTVTGRHGTPFRYRVLRTLLVALGRSGLIAIVVLGVSLAIKKDADFNVVQRYRLMIDHAVIDFLIEHPADLIFKNRQYVFTDQNFTNPRLSWAVWTAMGIGWLILIAGLQKLNRSLLSGWLFARRSTIKFTSAEIVTYRMDLPRHFQRDAVGIIQFKVESHPRLQRRLNASPEVQDVYQHSGRVTMVYGGSIVPIAIIVGAEAAGQFAICCERAAKRTKTNDATGSVTVRVELE